MKSTDAVLSSSITIVNMLSTESLAVLCQLPLRNFLWVTILYNLSYIWTTFIIWKSLFGINNFTYPPPFKKKQKNPKHTSKNAMFIHYINVLNLYTFTILGHDILNFYLYLHWNWSSQNQQYQVKSFKAFYTV